jgi:hypothetical protein
MRLTVFALVALLTLSGCPHIGPTVILDRSVAHEVAEPTEVEVYCHQPDGRWARCTAAAGPGWWLLGPASLPR